MYYITGVKWMKKKCRKYLSCNQRMNLTIYDYPPSLNKKKIHCFLYTTIFRCCHSRKRIHKERRTIQKSIRIQKSSQKWYLWNLSLLKWSSQCGGKWKKKHERKDEWYARPRPPTHSSINVCTAKLCNDSHKWKINNKALYCIFMSIELNSNIHNWISIWEVNHVEKKVIFRYYCDVDAPIYFLYLNPLKWLHNIMKYMKWSTVKRKKKIIWK